MNPQEKGEALPTAEITVVANKPASRPEPPVLSFAVAGAGTAQIRIEATMPLESAKPLLRMLLDAGCVFG